MNDRAISMLENYEMTALRSYKGRGAIIIETEAGLKILKEYSGREDRIYEINPYLLVLREQGFLVETYQKNKLGTYTCKDRDQKEYIIKDYFEGRECQTGEISDLKEAFRYLGHLQSVLKHMDKLPPEPKVSLEENMAAEMLPLDEPQPVTSKIVQLALERLAEENLQGSRFSYDVEKKNRELKRIWKYLRGRSQKNEFEELLLKYFNGFYQEAMQVQEMLSKRQPKLGKANALTSILCHGDFQYHNILFTEQGIALINFEKMIYDDASRDLANLFRKVMEKTGWNPALAKQLLEEYFSEYSMKEEEYEQFLSRICYPEKFRKTVNYYMNSKKMVLSDKCTQKLYKILDQEPARQECIKALRTVGMYQK